MQKLVTRLDKLDLNLRKLLLKMRQLEDDNSKLTSENADLKYRLENLGKNVMHDSGKEQIDQLAEWKENISTKLDDYIEELDACIDSLKTTS